MRPSRVLLGILVTLVSAACAIDASTGTIESEKDLNGRPKGDTGSTTLPPAMATVSGTVYSRVRVAASTPGGADTLRNVPTAGVRLTLYHNVLVNGRGESQFVGTFASDANGAYTFGAIPTGYYIVRDPRENVSYLDAHAAAVRLDVYVVP